MRIGYGYDLHRLVEGRRCWIGGVEIPSEKGLLGHSDADVLLHAITDALLGSLALGDIGSHFPDSDPDWEGRDSSFFLARIYQIILERGWRIVNIDSTVVAEAPRLRPHVESIRKRIGEILQISSDVVSVKATTNEKLGPVGREEAITAHAVVLVERIPESD